MNEHLLTIYRLTIYSVIHTLALLIIYKIVAYLSLWYNKAIYRNDQNNKFN